MTNAGQGGTQPFVAEEPDAIGPDGEPTDYGNALLDRYDEVEGLKALDALAAIGVAPSSVPVAPAALPASSTEGGAGVDRTAIEPPAPGVPPAPFQGDLAGRMPADPGDVFIGGLWRAAKGVAGDLVRGVPEIPKQALGAARDAAQSVIDLIETAGDELGRLAGAPTPQRNLPELPEVGSAKSVTVGMGRGIVQWLIGWKQAGKAVGLVAGDLGKASKAGKAVRAAGQGALTDFTFFDGQQGRLADLLATFPELDGATEFLQTDPSDSAAEGRFKNALEGLALGPLAEIFVKALSAIRIARRATATGRSGAPSAALEEGQRDILNVSSPDAPLVVRAGADLSPAGKLAKAADETTTGIDDRVTARSLTEQGLTPLGQGGEVFVNFGRIATPGDVKRALKNVADAMRPEIDAARRGVRTHKQTAGAAEEIDAFDTLMNRRKGQPLNAEESLAARQLWNGAIDRLQAVARAAERDPSNENLFAFRRQLAVAHAIQKEALGARTEIARALNAWKIPAGGGRERMAALEQMLGNAGGLQVNRDLARKIGGLNDREAVAGLIDKGVYARSREAVQEYFINALLSGPKTHVVNFVSNASIAVLNVAEHAVAAQLGRILGGEGVVAIGEAAARAHGMKQSFREAWRNAARAFRTGEPSGLVKFETGERTRAISSSAWNLRSESIPGRALDALGAIVTSPGRALQSEDEFFRTLGYRGSLHGQAYRQVQSEIAAGGLKREDAGKRLAELTDNPSEDMRMVAREEAEYVTLTSEPGPIVQWINAGRTRLPELKFLTPFVNVAANIFKAVGERSPLAPVMSRYREAIKAGGGRADLARTKMALGSMVMLSALDLALDGHLTGSGPQNPAERQNWLRRGFRPYAVKVGDRWVSVNRVDPLGSQIGFAADLGEYLLNAGEMDMEDNLSFERAIGAAIFSAAENVTNKSYLQGFAETVEAISEPESRGPSFIKRFVGGLLVPRALTEAARMVDPVKRETAGIVGELKSRVPFFSADLPPSRDYWGRPETWSSGLGFVYDALSPFYAGPKAAPEPIDEAMVRDGFFLGMPAKAFTIEGVRVPLNTRPDVYSRYLELRGQSKAGELAAKLAAKYGDRTLLQTLNDTVRGGAYEALDGMGRARLVRNIAEAYGDAARARTLAEFPELVDKALKARSKRALVPAAAEE